MIGGAAPRPAVGRTTGSTPRAPAAAQEVPALLYAPPPACAAVVLCREGTLHPASRGAPAASQQEVLPISHTIGPACEGSLGCHPGMHAAMRGTVAPPERWPCCRQGGEVSLCTAPVALGRAAKVHQAGSRQAPWLAQRRTTPVQSRHRAVAAGISRPCHDWRALPSSQTA